MAICRCKMCGGELIITEGQEIAVCESCGTKQTLPRISSDQLSKLLEKANSLRMNGDFDKALEVYDKITDEEDTNDPEIYWNKVICKYGIQYVEEDGKRIPTVNRAQFDSVLLDSDYKKCMENATLTTRELYESEAKLIDNIQQGILEISSQQEPYDVFISFKETDPTTGQRTSDSEDCYELYHALTNKGYRVFFSRVSLKQMAGSKYEPHIFAALQSAKVMILYGSSKIYFEAPWVRNEWSRFFALCKKNPQDKKLIPCYRGMNPEDLPKEISSIQGVDCSKMDALENIVGILEKVIRKKNTYAENNQMNIQSAGGQSQVSTIIKKAKLYIEQSNYENARKNLDVAFDIDPENWEIYLCRLLMDYNLTREENLKDLSATFEDNFNYKKILEFGDDSVRQRIEGYNKYINEQNSLKGDKEVYSSAEKLYADSVSNDKLNSAKKLYASIPNYKDAKEKEQECVAKIHDNIVKVIDSKESTVSDLNQALNDCEFIASNIDVTELKEVIGKCSILESQRSVFKNKFATVGMIEKAISSLAPIIDFADAADLRRALEEKKISVEKSIRRAKRYTTITTIFVACIIVCIFAIGALGAKLASNGAKVTYDNTGMGVTEKLFKYVKNGTPQANKVIDYKKKKIRTDDKGYLLMNRWQSANENYRYFKDDGTNAKSEFIRIKDIPENVENVSNTDKKLSKKELKKAYAKIEKSGTEHDYYFGDDTYLVYNKFVRDEKIGKDRYVGEKGYVKANSNIKEGGKWYYLDDVGAKRGKGWGRYNEDEFLVKDDGTLTCNTFANNASNQKVFLNENGVVVKGNLIETNGKFYYSHSDGTLYGPGLQEIQNYKFYFNDDNSMVVDEYREVDGKKYFFTRYGMARSGIFGVGNDKVYFDDNGERSGGWHEINFDNGKVYIYSDENGKCIVKSPKEIDGQIYYFDENAVMLKNTQAGGLYLADNGCAYRNCWDPSGAYRLNSGYVLQNNFTPDETYVGADGKRSPNKWVGNYYVGADAKKVKNSAVQYGNDFYYLGSDGLMVTDQTRDGHYYNQSGKLQLKAVKGDYVLVQSTNKDTVSKTRRYTKTVTEKVKNYSTGKYENKKKTVNETETVLLTFHKIDRIDIKPNTTLFNSEANALLNCLNSAESEIKNKASSQYNNWESFNLATYTINSMDNDRITINISCKYVSSSSHNVPITFIFDRNNKSYTLSSYNFND